MRTLGEPLLSPGAGEQQWAAGLSDSGDDDTVMSRVMFFLDLAKHARRPTWGSLSTYRFYHSHLYRKFFYVVVLHHGGVERGCEHRESPAVGGAG